MVTKTVWTCVAIAAVIAGAIFYRVGHTVPSAVFEQEIRATAADYSVGIKYPLFIGVNHDKDLNASIKKLLTEKIETFKEAVRKLNPGGGALAHKSGLYAEYTMTVFNPQLVTVRLKITSYLTGDEHPTTTIEVFSYDLENNSAIPVVIQ